MVQWRSAEKIGCALAGAILPVLFTVCAVSPSLCLVFVPAVCVAAYYLGVMAGAWALGVCAAVFAVGAAVLGSGSALYTAAAAILALLAAVCVFRKRLSRWCEIALCAAAGLIAVTAVFGIWALATGASIDGVIVKLVQSLSRDVVAKYLAKLNYSSLTAQVLGHAPLSVYDELYSAEIMRELAGVAERELDGNTLWYLSGFGAFAGGLACAATSALNRRDGTSFKMSGLRLGGTYVKAAVLPALVFALLAFYEPMQPVVRTVVNLMITLPCSLCGITLLYHSLSRVPGKGKIAALIGFWAAMLACALFWEWGLLILGFVGLADCIINVRKLLDWALN